MKVVIFNLIRGAIMKKAVVAFFIVPVFLFTMTVALGSEALGSDTRDKSYGPNPPFSLKLLKTTTGKDSSGNKDHSF